MKVVVFGGCGFLGSWLVKKLLDNNFKPIIFDKNKSLDEITSDLKKNIEKMILKNPDQWIWSHDRWK